MKGLYVFPLEGLFSKETTPHLDQHRSRVQKPKFLIEAPVVNPLAMRGVICGALSILGAGELVMTGKRPRRRGIHRIDIRHAASEGYEEK